MQEKRRAPRRSLNHYMTVFDRGTETYLGMLVEISQSGLKLTSPDPIDTCVHYQLALSDTPELREADTVAFFEATSIWCKKKSNAFYDTGFNLTDVSALAENILKRCQ